VVAAAAGVEAVAVVAGVRVAVLAAAVARVPALVRAAE